MLCATGVSTAKTFSTYAACIGSDCRNHRRHGSGLWTLSPNLLPAPLFSQVQVGTLRGKSVLTPWHMRAHMSRTDGGWILLDILTIIEHAFWIYCVLNAVLWIRLGYVMIFIIPQYCLVLDRSIQINRNERAQIKWCKWRAC